MIPFAAFHARRFAPALLCVSAFAVLLHDAGGAAASPQANTSASALPSLTPAQQQKLTALENASRAQAEQLFGHLRHLRERLSDLYGSYALDTTEARRLNSELNHVQSQLLDLRLSEQQGMRGILSPDQFTQLQASVKQHHGDWDDHPHDHGGGSAVPPAPGGPGPAHRIDGDESHRF